MVLQLRNPRPAPRQAVWSGPANALRCTQTLWEPGLKYKFALAACARWESPYVVEWLAYYQLLGFDHVFLYCNDDAPEEMYGLVLPFLLGPRPFVTFRHHPVQGEQYWMYVHFLRHHLDECEWIAFLDLDEFIRLPRGQSIRRFCRRLWRRGGLPAVQLAEFRHRAATPRRRRAACCKTTQSASASCTRSPSLLRAPASLSVTGFSMSTNTAPSGIIRKVRRCRARSCATCWAKTWPITTLRATTRRSGSSTTPARGGRHHRDGAVIQHYFHRSEVSFRQRVERGLGGAFGGQTLWKNMADSDTFRSYLENINLVPDELLAAFWAGGAEPRGPDRHPTGTAAAGCAGWRCNQSRARPAGDAKLGQPMVARPHAGRGCRRRGGRPADRRTQLPHRLGGGAVVAGRSRQGASDHRDTHLQRDQCRCSWAVSSDFHISIGFDEDSFIEVCRKNDDAEVGGIKRGPFIWKPELAAFERLVRVTAMGPGFLHLDQIEVYGRSATPAPVVGPGLGFVRTIHH